MPRRRFFFQAEDGIRDKLVTGVQTCALPICDQRAARLVVLVEPRRGRICVHGARADRSTIRVLGGLNHELPPTAWQDSAKSRSEERRVGKDSRSGWSS